MISAEAMRAFIESDEHVEALDRFFHATFAATGPLDDLSPWMAGSLAHKFSRLGFDATAAIRASLDANEPVVRGFMRAWVSGPVTNPVERGVSLLYVWFVLLAQADEATRIAELDESGMMPSDRTSLAEEVAAAYAAATSGGLGD